MHCRHRFGTGFILIFIVLITLSGCSRRMGAAYEAVYKLPRQQKVFVAPFTQPLNASQLITGHIPDDQGRISQDDLDSLDMDLREALFTGTTRTYAFIMPHYLPAEWSRAHSAEQPGAALSRWVEYARKNKMQYLLVPQVLNWHEREGSQAGVTKSAHVRLEFYLIDAEKGLVPGRSIYEEKQVGLAENLLTVGEFLKRKGQWVTAREISSEGIQQAIRELGL